MSQPSTEASDTDWHGAALVVAHPGHELRVHAWLEVARPIVFVLTDGSGHGDRGRLASTARVIDEASARRGTIFGRWSDRHAYRLILGQDVDAIDALVDELVDQLGSNAVETVVSDAVEGFNPVHDLCFVVASEAVRRLSRRRGVTVPHYHFPLEAAPDADLGQASGRSVRLELDDGALDRKWQVALDYPEMRDEVERARAEHGREAFRVERLWTSPATDDLAARVGDPPYYETHGERRVRDGIYDQVLRFEDHFRPIVAELRDRTARG